MARYFLMAFGTLFLLAGTFGGIVLRFVPPSSTLYWLLPPLGLAVGFLLVFRGGGWKIAVSAFLVTGVVTFLASDRIWPNGMKNLAAAPPILKPDSALPGSAMQDTILRVPETHRTGIFQIPKQLKIPAGFRLNLYAAGLNGPRFMAHGPGGLYISVPAEGKVVVLPDRDGDGVADEEIVFADSLDRPHGLAVVPKGLAVAESGRLLLLRDLDGDLRAEARIVLSEDFPSGGIHWSRTVVVGPDSHFYVSVGSDCNACVEKDRRRGAILRIPPDGGPSTLFASGLRNSVGLAFHPVTGDLWASENGRDMLGDDIPPDEINRVVSSGDYGWPHCFGDRIPDPELGNEDRCADTLPAAVELPAHSAPLGIAFGFDLRFPPPFQQVLYVAYHGSWNRTVPTGYKLVGIPFEDGRPAGPPQDIISGWLQGGSAWGRPVQPVVGADGALYLSDDRAGAIYRLSAPASDGGRLGHAPGNFSSSADIVRWYTFPRHVWQ